MRFISVHTWWGEFHHEHSWRIGEPLWPDQTWADVVARGVRDHQECCMLVDVKIHA